MRLTDLNPRWAGAGGEGITGSDGKPVPERHGVGMTFDCPCGCGQRRYVGFANPLDGGTQHDPRPATSWQRSGETFETLTLSPSILSHPEKGGCGWHGWIKDGEVASV